MGSFCEGRLLLLPSALIVAFSSLSCPAPTRARARQNQQTRLPDGRSGWEPCAPAAPGAQAATLQSLADKGQADLVVPPVITRTDFDKVRRRRRLRHVCDALASCLCRRVQSAASPSPVHLRPPSTNATPKPFSRSNGETGPRARAPDRQPRRPRAV